MKADKIKLATKCQESDIIIHPILKKAICTVSGNVNDEEFEYRIPGSPTIYRTSIMWLQGLLDAGAMVIREQQIND